MKILHVNDVAYVGSILVRASGGEDALFQPALRRHFEEGKIETLRFAAHRASDAPRLAWTFRSGRFTHLHVHYATFANLAELARVPYSLHVHGADVLLDPNAGGLKARLALRGIERATSIVVSTPDILEPTRALRPDAIYIPNPMELPPAPQPRAKSERPRIVVLSKMDPLKGWTEQVEVVEGVAKSLPDAEIRFFGHGQLTAEERDRLSRRLIAAGAELRRPMPHDELLADLGTYDFAIGQMEVGSLGMSEMEAMAAGVPVVADVRAHVALGYAPPVIRPDEAVREIVRLWQDEAARRAAGLAGRSFIEETHDPAASLAALRRHLSG
jgi:glycosyltransferase involved in cell wall biosynthesis